MRRLAPLALLAVVVVIGGCRSVPASVDTSAPAPGPAPVFVETPNPASEPAPAADPARPLSLASFEEFLGLRYGDRVERVYQIHGQPPYREDDSDLDTLYYEVVEDTIEDDGPPNAGDDFLYVITVDHQTGWVFNVEAHAGPHPPQFAEDPTLLLLGAPLSEVEAILGPPDDISSGFHTWEFEDLDRGVYMTVEFVCYEFEDWRCSELWVTWVEP